MDYEVSYEYDEGFTGEILAYNLRGHGLDLDEIERLLLGRYADDEIDEGGWEIREDWLRKVPSPVGSLHVYGKPGRGARAVTVLERPSQWGYWCTNDRTEPAQVGIPATKIVDGRALVAHRLAELADEIDPRPDVNERGYVYLCRACHDSFDERYKEALSRHLEMHPSQVSTTFVATGDTH